jgi:hypothetical protein
VTKAMPARFPSLLIFAFKLFGQPAKLHPFAFAVVMNHGVVAAE